MIDGLARRSAPAPCAEETVLGRALSAPPRNVITFFYYDDLSAAVSFYKKIIGLPLLMCDAWCAVFALNGGAQLGLVDAVAGSQRPISGANKGVILSLEVDDVAECLQRLKRASIADPADELMTGAGGRTQEFKVRDPGGYTVEFFHWAERPAPVAG